MASSVDNLFGNGFGGPSAVAAPPLGGDSTIRTDSAMGGPVDTSARGKKKSNIINTPE